MIRVSSPDKERFTLDDIADEIKSINEWLKKEHHPYTEVVIGGGGAQLVEIVESEDAESFPVDENDNFKSQVLEYITKRGLELQDMLNDGYEGFCESEPESITRNLYRQTQGAVPELLGMVVELGLVDEFYAVLDGLKAKAGREPSDKHTGSDGE